MSKNDFLIENGVLLKYYGNDSNVIIPDDITIIGCGAFANTNIQKVKMSNKITGIGEYAFYNCSFLDEVTFSEGLQLIGEYAFSNCESIKSISIPSNVIILDNHAFSGCFSLENVSFCEKSKLYTIGE